MAPLNCCIFDDLTAAVSSEIPMRYRGALPAASDVAALFLTSGLTGFSKIVAHTHQSLLAACQAKIGEYELGSRDTVLNCKCVGTMYTDAMMLTLSFSAGVGFDHVAGSIEMHLAPLLAGARQVHVSASSILSTELLFVELLDKHVSHWCLRAADHAGDSLTCSSGGSRLLLPLRPTFSWAVLCAS